MGLVEQLQWEAPGADGPVDIVPDGPALRALLDRDSWADRDAKPQKQPKRPKLWSPRFRLREGTSPAHVSRVACRSTAGSCRQTRSGGCHVLQTRATRVLSNPWRGHRRTAHWEPSSDALTQSSSAVGHGWRCVRNSCAGPSALQHRTRLDTAIASTPAPCRASESKGSRVLAGLDCGRGTRASVSDDGGTADAFCAILIRLVACMGGVKPSCVSFWFRNGIRA